MLSKMLPEERAAMFAVADSEQREEVSWAAQSPMSSPSMPSEFAFTERYYQCIVDPPGVGYRFTPDFEDKNRDGRGPVAPEVVVATEICQGPDGIFIKCKSGYGWLPLQSRQGQECFKHLGCVSDVDLGALGLQMAAHEDKVSPFASPAKFEVDAEDLDDFDDRDGSPKVLCKVHYTGRDSPDRPSLLERVQKS